jgi:hypothetical protein
VEAVAGPRGLPSLWWRRILHFLVLAVASRRRNYRELLHNKNFDRHTVLSLRSARRDRSGAPRGSADRENISLFGPLEHQGSSKFGHPSPKRKKLTLTIKKIFVILSGTVNDW